MTQAEQIAPLLKEAVASQIRVRELITQMEEIVAGEKAPESVRCQVEEDVSQYILDLAYESEGAEGIGLEDARLMLEEIGYAIPKD